MLDRAADAGTGHACIEGRRPFVPLTFESAFRRQSFVPR